MPLLVELTPPGKLDKRMKKPHRSHETICVAETYTVNSLPHYLMAIHKNATD